jgi:hypothetical protein
VCYLNFQYIPPYNLNQYEFCTRETNAHISFGPTDYLCSQYIRKEQKSNSVGFKEECRFLGCDAECSVLQLLVTDNVDPSSLTIITYKKEAIPFSETSALTRATRRYIPEDDILHSHRRENLKSYIRWFQSARDLHRLSDCLWSTNSNANICG